MCLCGHVFGLVVLFCEPAFGIEGRHTAHSGRGHRLTILVIRQVAGGEYAGYRGFGAARLDRHIGSHNPYWLFW